MDNKIIIKKCNKCNSIVEVIVPCNCKDCGHVCCGEQMQTLQANNKEFSFEKHMPEYEIKDNKVYVKVNHVMEEPHFIEWIAIKNKKGKQVVFLQPNEVAEVVFDYQPESMIYSYCNLHGLWAVEVK